jgi:regulator of replication initiation timing
MKTYVDREVLLQVKRIYSQDEIIADLHRQLKEYGIKVGILESQIAELEDENKSLRLNRQDEYVKNLKGTIQQLLKAKQKYKAESERWMGKFYTQYPKSKLEI